MLTEEAARPTWSQDLFPAGPSVGPPTPTQAAARPGRISGDTRDDNVARMPRDGRPSTRPAHDRPGTPQSREASRVLALPLAGPQYDAIAAPAATSASSEALPGTPRPCLPKYDAAYDVS